VHFRVGLRPYIYGHIWPRHCIAFRPYLPRKRSFGTDLALRLAIAFGLSIPYILQLYGSVLLLMGHCEIAYSNTV
jgi:hypothetical protein